jgi:hypothetical protein
LVKEPTFSELKTPPEKRGLLFIIFCGSMIFLLASNHSQVEAWATELWKKDAWMSALDEVSKLKFDGSGDWIWLAVTQEWDQDILLRSQDQKIEKQ